MSKVQIETKNYIEKSRKRGARYAIMQQKKNKTYEVNKFRRNSNSKHNLNHEICCFSDISMLNNSSYKLKQYGEKVVEDLKYNEEF